VVEVDLRGGDQIVATITRQSVESLNLSPGCEVMALVKSSAVMLARDLRPGQVSARNLLCGRVCRIVEGAVNCEVTLQLPGGSTVHAVITRESAIHLDLQPESELCALIKASSVLLAIA
jgi:molybdate transport system regulatory protein